ncbi:MAG: hypothetical protein EP329_20340 [Deltaproteobacteria bacterium]|nr:MAG: hypothetical protein EP329_20340 [Deltaproteobacteria bacterium]
MRTPIVAALAFLFLLTGACASGPAVGVEVEPGVVLLGQRKVDLRVDHDVIGVGRVEGRFRALRVHVAESPLEMYDIKVTFGNGNVWSPPTRLLFSSQSWTRRIDLPGDARIVRKVEFVYRSRQPASGRALVTLYGLR